MADVVMDDHEKDMKLMQFLSMTEDRVDPEVAGHLLESCGWDLQAAVAHLYDGPTSRPATGVPPVLPGGDDFAGMEDEPPSPLIPGGMDVDPALLGHGGEDHDLQFALAGQQVSEEDLIRQALEASQREEENRQRQNLREQQEAELQESILMDRMREEQRAVEAVQQAQEAEAAKARETEARAAEAAAEEALKAKKAALPAEPAADEPGRRALMLRLPGGQRLQRAFRGSETVGLIYDFVDVTSSELSGQSYRLVSTLPRKVFEDRTQSLDDAGIQNQFVLMVEVAASS